MLVSAPLVRKSGVVGALLSEGVLLLLLLLLLLLFLVTNYLWISED